MLTNEQLEKRKNYCTGSDAPVLLGIGRMTPLDLFLYKKGRAEREQINQDDALRGTFMEPAAREWFAYKYKKNIVAFDKVKKHFVDYFRTKKDIVHVNRDNGFLSSNVHPFMGGNIDGYIPEENALVEIKTSRLPQDWNEDLNQVPLNYLSQVAHYCELTGAEKAYIVVVFWGCDLKVFTYTKNTKLQQLIVSKEREFWVTNMATDTPPDPIRRSDIQIAPEDIKADPITASFEIQELARKYNDLKEQAKEIKNKQDAIEDEIAIFMNDREILKTEDNARILATWSSRKGRQTFDTKSFEVDYPELYDKYKKVGQPSRALIIKKVK